MVFISADPSEKVCVYILANNASNNMWTTTHDYWPDTFISARGLFEACTISLTLGRLTISLFICLLLENNIYLYIALSK